MLSTDSHGAAMIPEQKSIEQELFAAEQARREAITSGNVDRIEKFLADTFYYAHISGLVENREEFLERTRTKNAIRFTSASDLVVQPREGYALLTGKSRIEIASAAIETLFLSVWERDATGWKITAYASTPLPKSAR
jgi:hypothetical protein